MAGPGSSIIFDYNPLSEILEEINSVIEAISEKMEGSDFWVSSTRSINGNVTAEGRPFMILKDEFNSHDEYGEEEIDSMSLAIGFTPKYEINLSAMCNKEIDHRILGELTLYIAEKFSGIINFQGAIYPYNPLPHYMKKGMWLWEQASWEDIKPFFNEMIMNISGNIYSIEYETVNGKIWVYHLSNAEFLKNWLKSPEFHMIK